MASRFHYFSYDELVGLYEAINKNSLAYCSPDDYGVTAEECETYLKKLLRGERWSRRFISSLTFLGYLIVFAAAIGNILTYVKHFPIYISLLTGVIVGIMLFGWIRVALTLSISPPSFIKRPFYPPINKNVERFFNDFLKKEEALKLNLSQSEVKQLEVICQSHPEVAECCIAVREELSHPSGKFIIGDLRFGMTEEELHQSAVYRGIETLKRLSSPGYSLDNYLHLFFYAFWNINNAIIHFDMSDNRLIGIRINGSDHPRPNPDWSPWDEGSLYEDMEDYPEYEACDKRLNEIYGQRWFVEGKEISLLRGNGESMTIQIRNESYSAALTQKKQEQKTQPVERNENSSKKKEEDNPQFDPYHVPGAHYENWERCS